MNKICDIESLLNDQKKLSLLCSFFGKDHMNDSKNAQIFNATIRYTLSTERFNFPLYE